MNDRQHGEQPCLDVSTGVIGEGRWAPTRLPGSWPRLAETRERMETAPGQEQKQLEAYHSAKSEEQKFGPSTLWAQEVSKR